MGNKEEPTERKGTRWAHVMFIAYRNCTHEILPFQWKVLSRSMKFEMTEKGPSYSIMEHEVEEEFRKCMKHFELAAEQYDFIDMFKAHQSKVVQVQTYERRSESRE